MFVEKDRENQYLLVNHHSFAALMRFWVAVQALDGHVVVQRRDEVGSVKALDIGARVVQFATVRVAHHVQVVRDWFAGCNFLFLEHFVHIRVAVQVVGSLFAIRFC